ncbi:histidine phosphatase family protein [Nocardioides nitrophenolicus]|uniref:histidine phosphatase family protein n=1 Tax=Nocardioides nitrophenolicus TaxID=60489 RepID=UPI00195B8C7D|nr:histidine phosphatase family protein [Nocardioides nitrophenolicus]MBM7519682.1 putative phosphoglycerate mutase [Nocardioides nitrophenolicus]
MTGRRLVLVRHGQTAWNAERRIQGQLDVELDATGRAQAEAVAPVIAALEPTLIWSSDLARARQTADTIAKEAGLVPTYDERLREFRLGDYQGLTHAELDARDPAAFARFQRGDWDAIPGAETPREVAARYAAAVTDLATALAPGETGVAVSHGAATRSGLVTFLGWPFELARDLRALGNCARVVLEQRTTGRWALASYNG